MTEIEVYDDLFFYQNEKEICITSMEFHKALVINRSTGKMVAEELTNHGTNRTPELRVCGVLGIIPLAGGPYLVMATHRLFVGILNGRTIWKLAGHMMTPIIYNSASKLTSKQQEQNENYMNMVKKILDTPSFYFSYTYDLSHSLQRLHSMPPNFFQTALSERADKRLIWNGHLMKDFKRPGLNKFALPLVLGFVSINNVTINGATFTWSIISRRSANRAGTRLFCRGIDDNGNVANYVETEQIVECNDEKISFVQTRGSMPFYWNQTPNLQYKPPPEITPGKDHLNACQKHYNEQLSLYGRQIAINLVDQKGAEGVLEKMYHTLLTQLNNPSVRYEAFDFHKECKKMRYGRAHILIDRLASELEDFGVFNLRDDGVLLSTQTGVFRTNCIDCLDRTNVIQSMFARRSLTQSLSKLGVLRHGQSIENASSSFEAVFKGVWADNADFISLQYSGTGALKTDFTRTGKRTKSGLLKDGANSLSRYYINNFSDGFRQDAIDLFLGNYNCEVNVTYDKPSPFDYTKGWKYATFPSILLFAIAMFFASAIFPTEYGTENLLFIFFWGTMIGLTAAGILHYGIEFVDWPKLNPLRNKEAEA